MSPTRTLHPRRAAGLAGLLSAAALLVALKASSAPAPHKVSLGATTARAPASGGGSHQPTAITAARRRLLGAPVDVGYGTVQVRVTMSRTRITNVSAVRMPAGRRSSDISDYAAAELRREVLAAQSATIDVVSGASYTSEGYARSLQSALDAARR